jgi:hypothetical protein
METNFDLTNNLGTWLGLSDRTSLEHDQVVLKIPVGAMRWPANNYKEVNSPLKTLGSLTIEVSGLSLNMSFKMSDITHLTSLEKHEQFEGGEDPHTNIAIQGVALAPKELRVLIVWLISTLRPMEFIMLSA